MTSNKTNLNNNDSIGGNHQYQKQRKEKIKVHHSLMEIYTDTGLIDEYDIEVDYSNERKNNTYGVTGEELDNPNFWLEL